MRRQVTVSQYIIIHDYFHKCSGHKNKKALNYRKEQNTMLSGIADFVAWILDMTGDKPEMHWFDKIGDWLGQIGL